MKKMIADNYPLVHIKLDVDVIIYSRTIQDFKKS
jgi:hypothetical protein